MVASLGTDRKGMRRKEIREEGLPRWRRSVKEKVGGLSVGSATWPGWCSVEPPVQNVALVSLSRKAAAVKRGRSP